MADMGGRNGGGGGRCLGEMFSHAGPPFGRSREREH